METLNKIEDRTILLFLTVGMVAAYIITKDPLIGDKMGYLLGAVTGVMVARASKTLNVSGNAETAAVVKEFLGAKQ